MRTESCVLHMQLLQQWFVTIVSARTRFDKARAGSSEAQLVSNLCGSLARVWGLFSKPLLLLRLHFVPYNFQAELIRKLDELELVGQLDMKLQKTLENGFVGFAMFHHAWNASSTPTKAFSQGHYFFWVFYAQTWRTPSWPSWHAKLRAFSTWHFEHGKLGKRIVLQELVHIEYVSDC